MFIRATVKTSVKMYQKRKWCAREVEGTQPILRVFAVEKEDEKNGAGVGSMTSSGDFPLGSSKVTLPHSQLDQ